MVGFRLRVVGGYPDSSEPKARGGNEEREGAFERAADGGGAAGSLRSAVKAAMMAIREA